MQAMSLGVSVTGHNSLLLVNKRIEQLKIIYFHSIHLFDEISKAT